MPLVFRGDASSSRIKAGTLQPRPDQRAYHAFPEENPVRPFRAALRRAARSPFQPGANSTAIAKAFEMAPAASVEPRTMGRRPAAACALYDIAETTYFLRLGPLTVPFPAPAFAHATHLLFLVADLRSCRSSASLIPFHFFDGVRFRKLPRHTGQRLNLSQSVIALMSHKCADSRKRSANHGHPQILVPQARPQLCRLAR
jgi:hypothetical protein